MKVAIGQINTTIGDFAGNISRIRDFHAQAAVRNADLVIFPELAIPGYPPRDLLLKTGFVDDNLAALENLARQIDGPPLIVGYVDRNRGVGRPLRNSAAVIASRRVTNRVHKQLLPTYDVFDEDRYFEPAETVQPIVVGGRRIGLTICEDIWNDEDFWPQRLYRRDPVRALVAQGVDLLLNISASPWHLGKENIRLKMMKKIAGDERLPLVYCNAVGGNDELIFDGNSLAFDNQGGFLAQGKSFEEDLIVIDLESQARNQEAGSRIQNPESRIGDLFRALTLGLRDYTRKCGFRSVVLGLSGGIDSALTAVLAAAALGKENVLGVAMPSRFSSDGSLTDARAVAQNLGIRFETIPIQTVVDGFRSALAPVFAGRPEDTTEENLQSRIRGVTLMALSNKFGSLLITTGNKSELATGYCTLYGDMCGGLAAISDLSKMQVYALARWINQHPEQTGFRANVIPESSIVKPPSAELKPDQTDQDTLPPYDILDQILEGYVERHETATAIIQQGLDARVVQDLVRRIDQNEYKRRQSAPGLRVTSKAFGIGRRIPIAQKYREQLAASAPAK